MATTMTIKNDIYFVHSTFQEYSVRYVRSVTAFIRYFPRVACLTFLPVARRVFNIHKHNICIHISSLKFSHVIRRRGLRLGMDQFCQLTSLHGWNYCFRPEKPKIHTAGWILVIVTAVISAIALVVGILMEFREATVSVTLSTTTAPLDDFMFPAVTICNTLQIKKSVVSRLANELGNVTEDEIVDVASLLIQTRHGQLNADQLNIRDRIIGSQVISDIADEMVDKIYKDREVTEEEMYRKQPLTVSKYHSIFNRGKPFEKTFDNLLGLFPQFVNQLDPVDTVSGIYMATASFTEFAKGTNTDFGDTCLWMPFLGYNATMTEYDYDQLYLRSDFSTTVHFFSALISC